MTIIPASNAMTTINKRVQFDYPPDDNIPKPLTHDTNLTPKASSIQSICSFAVTLRKHLSPIYLTAGLSHIEHLHKWNHKYLQLKKMADDDNYTPRSARLDTFQFRVSRQVEASDAFLEVVAIIMDNFRKSLKQQIIATLRIEIKILLKELYNNLVKELHVIIKSTLLCDNSKISPHTILSLIIHYHSTDLLEPFDIPQDELCKLYKKTHALPIFPVPNGQQPRVATEDTEMLEDHDGNDPINHTINTQPDGDNTNDKFQEPHPDQISNS